MGSSQTNSVLELAFGYNGINRLTGNTSVTGSSHKQPAQTEQQTASSETKQNSNSMLIFTKLKSKKEHLFSKDAGSRRRESKRNV